MEEEGVRKAVQNLTDLQKITPIEHHADLPLRDRGYRINFTPDKRFLKQAAQAVERARRENLATR